MTTMLVILMGLILNQPYSLTVEEVTPQLAALCRADENCMDVVEIEHARDVEDGLEGEGCTTDADCCAKFPGLDPDLCGGK